jgi:hypothetical protein
MTRFSSIQEEWFEIWGLDRNVLCLEQQIRDGISSLLKRLHLTWRQKVLFLHTIISNQGSLPSNFRPYLKSLLDYADDPTLGSLIRLIGWELAEKYRHLYGSLPHPELAAAFTCTQAFVDLPMKARIHLVANYTCYEEGDSSTGSLRFTPEINEARRRTHLQTVRFLSLIAGEYSLWNPSWGTSTVRALATQIYQTQDFSVMLFLADALQDAGCDHQPTLDYLCSEGPFFRGIFLLDKILKK